MLVIGDPDGTAGGAADGRESARAGCDGRHGPSSTGTPRARFCRYRAARRPADAAPHSDRRPQTCFSVPLGNSAETALFCTLTSTLSATRIDR